MTRRAILSSDVTWQYEERVHQGFVVHFMEVTRPP